MKGILKNTKAGWFVLYQVMKDEITSGYDSIPLHPDNEESLIEGNEVEFDIITVEEPYYLFAEIINKDALGCSYPIIIIRNDDKEEFIHLSNGFYRTKWGILNNSISKTPLEAFDKTKFTFYYE
jgi:hypothetical protein